MTSTWPKPQDNQNSEQNKTLTRSQKLVGLFIYAEGMKLSIWNMKIKLSGHLDLLHVVVLQT